MKKLFYVGLAGLVLFEAANVYFIMPMPFSQRMRSIDVAYFLFTSRWAFRCVFGLMAHVGARQAFSAAGWRKAPAFVLAPIAAFLVYVLNFQMAADRMFLEPASVRMQTADRNVVEPGRLVVGIEVGGDARAYPNQFIGYHHQVRDSAGGKPVMVSYCTVCRTGRVFEPMVDGKLETFRLVGMDHFNAMFEDRTTRSWWRQATGEAITGPSKGKFLKELPSVQVSLGQWLAMHPKSLIMQPDSTMLRRYPTTYAYESGASKSSLTGTDTGSWNDKSWVVGVAVNGGAKAFDWNRLKKERVVNDVVGGKAVVVALASDGLSFYAYERPDAATKFTIRGDSLLAKGKTFALGGKTLPAVSASQEFWHSWRTFHPTTETY